MYWVKKMLTFENIKNNQDINTYIESADTTLKSLGFTEHSFAHVTKTANTVKYILTTLNQPSHDVELAQIAAYLHDIGNVVNRIEHSQSGAVMAFRILDNLNMPASDTAKIVSAIGNHDEGTGVPIDQISAALILADKSDVRRSRVRNTDVSTFDIHDRVNYSVVSSSLKINDSSTEISLNLKIDTEFASIMEFFEIFIDRMLLCQKAAAKLGLKFNLEINNQSFL